MTIYSAHSTSNMYPSNLGLVFTDARGRVVFADTSFLALIGQESGRLVGEPLHKIIHTAQDAMNALLRDIARAGYVHEHPLTIIRTDGAQIETICTGVATYDDRKSFIGADLTLRDPRQATPHQPATHSDVLGARIQQIEAEADAQIVEDALLANLYFTAMVSAVQVLLARMGGPRVYEAVEDLINQRALELEWPVKLADGHFIMNPAHIPANAYHTLLGELVDYARNIVGGRVLSQEMHALDEQMKPEAREIASQFNMRYWVT